MQKFFMLPSWEPQVSHAASGQHLDKPCPNVKTLGQAAAGLAAACTTLRRTPAASELFLTNRVAGDNS
jgi:hypothetical protein